MDGDEVSFVSMDAVGEWGGLRLDQSRSYGTVRQGYTAFVDGDVVCAKITPCFENGKGALASGLVNGVGFGTTELHVLRATSRSASRFIFYLTQTHQFRALGAAEMYGAGGQKRVPEAFVENFPVAAPSTQEQRNITEFLDRKTAALDALIEKKERLIALLEEKWQAVIVQVVTTGLDPSKPLRDTGLGWMGQIPAHWELKKLKHLSPRLAGRLIVQPHLYFSDIGVPILFAYNIRPGWLDLTTLKTISYEADSRYPHCRVRAGDILTVRVGDPGTSAVVPLELDGCHFASTMLIRQSPQFNPTWLCYSMNSRWLQVQVDLVNYGAAQKQFNIGDAAHFLLPTPPRSEQDAIASQLDDLGRRHRNTTGKIQRHITLLREYRQALITAAVTGQIDVTREDPDAIPDVSPCEVPA